MLPKDQFIMSLYILILLATIFYTLFDIFAARASGKIDANLSAILFNGLGAIVPLGIYAYLKMKEGVEVVQTTAIGITYSILAGASIAVFSILLIRIFEKGGLSYVVPLIYGGTIILAAVIGWFVFKEQANWAGILGVLVIGLGVGLVVYSKTLAV